MASATDNDLDAEALSKVRNTIASNTTIPSQRNKASAPRSLDLF